MNTVITKRGPLASPRDEGRFFERRKVTYVCSTETSGAVEMASKMAASRRRVRNGAQHSEMAVCCSMSSSPDLQLGAGRRVP